MSGREIRRPRTLSEALVALLFVIPTERRCPSAPPVRQEATAPQQA